MLKYDWIVFDYGVTPNEHLCKRCGNRQVLPAGPMPVDIFAAIGKAFIRLHKDCKEELHKDESNIQGKRKAFR